MAGFIFSYRWSVSLFARQAIIYRGRFFSARRDCPFGLLLDIDGVILRGRDVLPGAYEAMRRLTDKGRFRVPTVFVTNAGNVLRSTKARKLSELLDVEINADQVIMSHSPLRMFRDFHDKHVFVSGQGPVLDIAQNLGFTRVTTIEDLREAFPNLDCVDHKRRKFAPCAFEHYFPPIETVILFGEPINWETSFQLIIDVLMTNGKPASDLELDAIPYPHIPLLACNMDLLWLAEACLPRFGHGMFMMALETMYKKLTGYDLKYTALMGKPSELTYHHAEYCLKQHAISLNLPNTPTTLYAIGDNPESDILGANLFNRFLQQRGVQKHETKVKQQKKAAALAASLPFSYELDHIDSADVCFQDHGAEHCWSVLVQTGVYSSQQSRARMNSFFGASRHFDALGDLTELKRPMFVEDSFQTAVEMIFRREGFS